MRSLLVVVALLVFAVPAFAAPDVEGYELTVVVHDERLEVEAVLALAAGAGRTLELDLSPTMRVESMDAGSPEATFAREGSKLTVDRKGCADATTLRFRLTGSPRNQFSKQRGGFLRTVVGPEATYVRSQYAWYPRLSGDAATYRTVVKARKDWRVRTAGETAEPTEENGLRVWTFVTERPVRDVGLVAGPYVRRKGPGNGDLLIDALVLPGDEEGADRLLGVAQSVFDHYTARFGAVELKRFTIVEMPRAFGVGSGYGEDGYVLIGRGAFGDASWGADLVAHEIAHTWWGREVSFRRFASETLATYATLGWIESARGADAGRKERRRAIETVLRAADAGKEIALAEIEAWGRGMDPETYRAHAYEKGMMLLSMVEDALGRKKLDARLSGFFADHRGVVVEWSDLRRVLAKGPARSVVEQWEVPGIPTLEVTFEVSKSGRRQKVKGAVTQAGTAKPFRLVVPVVVRSGEAEAEDVVKLSRQKAAFTVSVDAPPDAVLLDPDWRLLVRAPRGQVLDAGAVIDEAFQVVNAPNEKDRTKNENAVRLLRELLAAGAGKHEGLCHTGIGRCLFRLGRNEGAKKELEEALRLGGGGPFHRRWIHLRLGCIADLAGKRNEASAHYQEVVASGKGDYTTKLAKRYLETPYDGD